LLARELNGWDELSLDDLFFAFRKAKIDCFYESSIRVCERFVEYEQNLADNLDALLARLTNNELIDVLLDGMGNPILFPKRLNFAPDDSSPTEGHTFFSDANRAFKKAIKQKVMPEFRLIGDFTVDCHILSALWVNLIGHKFDARLSPRALASRVRRYRATKEREHIGAYHLEALGSFEPYFGPYRKWRDDGIRAMRASVASGDPIIAITLDVGNFYHSIDPSFFADPEFIQYMGVIFNDFEVSFNLTFSKALAEWSGRCAARLKHLGCSKDDVVTGGIPIGLSIVRIISNAVLSFLDEKIDAGLSPIYYSRYVDDLFLVLKDNAGITSQADLWRFISEKVPNFSLQEDGNVELGLPQWGGRTRLKLQASKQKTFFLSGRSGLDLLENIASQIRDVSSERRLMPLAESLQSSQSAKALSATDSADDADSLRRADGLTLRRLGWSVLLRSVNTLARDLQPKDWAKERDDFYNFAHEHVIRPDKILEQIDHLPRLFSLAISLSDWKQALRVYRETISSIYKLEEATSGRSMRINGIDASLIAPEVWDETRFQVDVFFREALIRAYPLQPAAPTVRAFQSILKELSLPLLALERLALHCREADWSRIAYREHLRHFATRCTPIKAGEERLYGRYPRQKVLRQFLSRSAAKSSGQVVRRLPEMLANQEGQAESMLPFLFPTRPYTPEEIALYLPNECVFAEPIQAERDWADYTRAVRGVWVRSEIADEVGNSDEPPEPIASGDGDIASPLIPPLVVVSGSPLNRPIRLGITSFATSDETWSKAAAGTPDLSPARYRALAKIVNAAVGETPKPDYLILPELSMPERWITTIAGRLLDAGISLVAGLDYDRHAGNEIDSSALLVLTDDRLGYPSSLQVRQRKELPAPAEEENLFVSHGQTWKQQAPNPKPVYIHNGMHMGVLVCSELQNIEYRSAFQGHVDCMLILSWNKDIETFSALVDSACFDVHAYIALVNNLRYGDSRLRRPAKQSHLRDVCRVRGGLNNQLVVVELNPTQLRAQQSRAKRWPKKNDAYKPAPEGFVISDARRSLPS